jgi:hypothetical protein
MPHNALIRNPTTLWINGGTIFVAELTELDQTLAASVNGTDGSAHAPVHQGTIDGSSVNVTGPTQVAYGGTLTSTAILGGGYSCEDGDYPQFGPGHSGATQQRMACALDGSPVNDPLYNAYVLQQTSVSGGTPPLPIYTTTIPFVQPPGFRARWADLGVQALSPTIDFSDGQGQRAMSWRFPIRGYDGSKLTQVVVGWHVATPHSDVPPTMPRIRVIRVDGSGNVSALTSLAAGADANGYVSVPTPLSAGAWYNGGQPQSLTIPCDQNNAIAVGTADWYVEVLEESGLNGFPWQTTVKAPVVVATTGLHPVNLDGGGGTTTIDGVAVGNWGERVLVTGGVNPSGTWHANSGYSAGALVVGTGSAWRVTTPGSSGNTVPTWPSPAPAGATIQDGSVIWTSLGAYSSGTFSPDPVGNGIWIASTTTWLRASDLDTAADFSQGFVVPITSGNALAGSLAQCSADIASWNPGRDPLLFVSSIASDDPSNITSGQALFARGTVWHGALATFTGITQNAFD